MDDDYGTRPQDYLARCRDRLLERSKPGLFYAALELRCCVEARLRQYFEHYEPLARKKFQPYRLADNQRIVTDIAAGDAIVQVTFHLADGTTLRQFHTPVPPGLQRYVKRSVDELRHSQALYRPPDDPWWTETREGLIEAYRAAWIACRGELPLSPMWNPRTRLTHPVTVNLDDGNQVGLARFRDMRDETVQLHIDHLDAPPADWACDL